jgi:protein phosphatase 1L
VFKNLDEQFLQVARQECSDDGSTCLMGLILNGRLTVANIGDSIATLAKRDGTWEQLNVEHTPTRADERCRIEASNGSVFQNRINGELSVSRAFGDKDLKELVISEPEGRTMPITQEDDLLILASDGIHRSYTQDHIVRRVQELRKRHLDLGNIAETIVEECLRLENVAKPCYDNVTLIIVSLGDYLMDYEKRSLVNTPQQLQLRKQSSLGHSSYKATEFAVECHSLLQLSEGDRCSVASASPSQVSTNVNVN